MTQTPFSPGALDAIVWDNMDDGVLVAEDQDTVLMANPALACMLGYQVDELAGVPLGRLFPEFDAANEAFLNKVAGRLVAHGSWQGEVSGRMKDGCLLAAFMRLSERVVEGRPHWIAFVREVAEQPEQPAGSQPAGEDVAIHSASEDQPRIRALEEDLRAQQELLIKAQRIARLGGWEWDIVTDELTLSGELMHIVSGADVDLGGLGPSFFSYVERVHPEDQKVIAEAIQATFDHDEPYSVEFRVVTDDGGLVYCYSEGELERDAAGNPLRLVGMMQDITARKKAERDLLQSERRYRALVEAMSEGLGSLDADFRITFANPALSQMLGYSQEELLGMHVQEVIHPQHRGTQLEQLGKRRKGQTADYETVLWRKDRSHFWGSISARPVIDDDGHFQGSLAVIRDITDVTANRRILEQRVHKRTEALSGLLATSRAIASTLDEDALLEKILELLGDVVLYESAQIWIRRDTTLVVGASRHNYEGGPGPEKHVHLPDALIFGKLLDASGPVVFEQIAADESFMDEIGRVFGRPTQRSAGRNTTLVIAPLVFKNKLDGFITLFCDETLEHVSNRTNLVEAFANQAAIAIENAEMYRSAQMLAVSEERNRLARDFHDSVSQTLYSINLYAKAAQLAVISENLSLAGKHVSELRRLIREALVDMRLLIFELRPPILEQAGLEAALKARLDAVEARAGVDVHFTVEGENDLPLAVQTQLYRLAQEAITNVLKHAAARSMSVSLVFEGQRTVLQVQDDGQGFDLESLPREGKLGLRNIRERAQQMGGLLTINSRPGEGTVIRVELQDEMYGKNPSRQPRN